MAESALGRKGQTHGRAGLPARVVVLTDRSDTPGPLIGLRLRAGWDVLHAAHWRDAAEADIVLVPIRNPSDSGWREAIDDIRDPHRPQIVLVCFEFEAEDVWRLGPVPGCWLAFPQDQGDLATIVGAIGNPDPCHSICREISRRDMVPHLDTAIRHICGWRPPPFAAEPNGRSSLPSISTVAFKVGCSLSHLYGTARDADIHQGALLRGIVLIRGLQLRSGTKSSWTTVAVRLGFSSPSSWSNFVQRHWSMSPSEACQRDPEEWITRVVAAALRRV